MLAAIGEAEMADWDDFIAYLLDGLRRFVEGDAEPYKRLWSRRDDVTIFGGSGGYEQGWANVGPRLDWAAECASCLGAGVFMSRPGVPE
jgi:hypothetical protein